MKRFRVSRLSTCVIWLKCCAALRAPAHITNIINIMSINKKWKKQRKKTKQTIRKFTPFFARTLVTLMGNQHTHIPFPPNYMHFILANTEIN